MPFKVWINRGRECTHYLRMLTIFHMKTGGPYPVGTGRGEKPTTVPQSSEEFKKAWQYTPTAPYAL